MKGRICERDGKNSNQDLSRHHVTVLAQYPQSDGQLAISSGQVEADQLAIVYTNTHTSFPLSLMSLLYSSDHPVLCKSLHGRSPSAGACKKPDGFHSCVSVCVCMLACLLPPRQLATGPTELRGFSRAHGAEEETVQRARHFMHTCMLSHKQTQEHSRACTHTQPPLIAARLSKFKD